jgi:hypothetical protein
MIPASRAVIEHLVSVYVLWLGKLNSEGAMKNAMKGNDLLGTADSIQVSFCVYLFFEIGF